MHESCSYFIEATFLFNRSNCLCFLCKIRYKLIFSSIRRFLMGLKMLFSYWKQLCGILQRVESWLFVFDFFSCSEYLLKFIRIDKVDSVFEEKVSLNNFNFSTVYFRRLKQNYRWNWFENKESSHKCATQKMFGKRQFAHRKSDKIFVHPKLPNRGPIKISS